MESSLQEYPALLASLQPNHAATVLNDRINVINKVNSDIAEWLRERRRVEDQYVASLRKLAKRPMQDHGAALGVFQIPWKRIVSSTESLAESHETFSSKIEADVAKPLKEYSSKNTNMQSMPNIQSDLAGLAKSVETTQKKADKMKGSKSSEKTTKAANDARQQWESRAPYVFEQLQAVDENRVNHLRDVLTQLETHELDLTERNRKSAENCLNALLGVQTEDEIKRFVTKIGGGTAATGGSGVGIGTSSARHTPTTSETTAPLPEPPKIGQDDTASQLSGRSAHSPPTPAPQPQPRQTAFGGLRRLGTVMHRRKSIVGGPNSGFIQEKKPRGPFGTRRGGSTSQDSQQPASPTPPQTAQTEALSITSHDDASIRPTSARRGTSNDQMEPISEGQQTPTATNGVEITGTTLQEEPQKITGNGTDAEGFSTRPDTIDEITRLQKEASAAEEASPNLTIRDQPIHEDENAAQQAMSEMANQLRLQAQHSGIRRNVGTLRGRRDVRNTVFVPNNVTAEQELSGQSPGIAMPPVSPQPPKAVASPPSVSEDRAVSDTTSVHSSHTLHTLAGPITHPDLHEPGLNASITETVSAWFEGGVATKSYAVGEVALAYNPAGDSSPKPERIRLDNFQILEKVAANPNFITEAALPSHSLKGKERETGDDEKTGEYTVSLPIITRSTPTVAFKYQIHTDPSNPAAYAPVIFTPTWNLEEKQASVIVTYTPNPSYTSQDTIILKNVVLTVNLDLSEDENDTSREIARATKVVMYPNVGATFRRKLSAVVWKMPEFQVKAGEDGKFLARFSTDVSWPRKGAVEAKFEVHTTTSNPRLGVSACYPNANSEHRDIDPFADEIPGTVGAEPKPNLKAWKEVPASRKLVAGKYLCA
ncbi:hypothetical protein FQN54_000055 [Arachnomyces sp. PD_36]|nr:hypothetical protein FQN54_000055 [Arachnomyces sp. PD_36]